MNKKNVNTLLGMAATGLFLASQAAQANNHKTGKAKTADKKTSEASQCSGKGGCEGHTFKCEGANSCKGKSDCSTAKNSCKGHNSCKGKGWVATKDAAECETHKKAHK